MSDLELIPKTITFTHSTKPPLTITLDELYELVERLLNEAEQ